MSERRIAKVKAVQVGDLDELLVEIAGKTAELAAIPGAEGIKELQKEVNKQTALITLDTLKGRRVSEQKLIELDKTGRLKTLAAEVVSLRKMGESGKYLSGVFIPALAPTHPVMVRKAEIESIITSGLKEANSNVDVAIQQQIAYCKQMDYVGEPARTTSKHK